MSRFWHVATTANKKGASAPFLLFTLLMQTTSDQSLHIAVQVRLLLLMLTEAGPCGSEASTGAQSPDQPTKWLVGAPGGSLWLRMTVLPSLNCAAEHAAAAAPSEVEHTMPAGVLMTE